jgi:uncharacterized protein YfaS (alpha-2-macroglobulin family)
MKVFIKKLLLGIIIFLATCAIIAAGVVIGFKIFKENSKNLSLNVIATIEKDDITELETAFDITTDKDTNLEIIKNAVSVTPAIEYDVQQIHAKYYKLTPKEPLASDAIYNVNYKNEDKIYKWSFQTEKKHIVTSVYPKEDYDQVNISTIIEVNFSYKPNDNISEYFEISPKVEGKFEIDERRVKFIPNNNLDLATKYELTIKKGFGNKENENLLEEDFTSMFYTTITEERSLNLTDFEFLYTFNENTPINIITNLYDVEDNYKANIEFYKYRTEENFQKNINTQKDYSYCNTKFKIDLSGIDKIYSKDNFVKDLTTYEKNSYYRTCNLEISSPLEAGYYLAIIKIGDNIDYVNIQVNRNVAYATYTDNTTIVWVNDLITKSPIVGADVYKNGIRLGSTNSEGYFRIDEPERKKSTQDLIEIKTKDYQTLYLVINYYYWHDYEDDNINEYIYTDRLRYRVGETVNVWGFVKNRKQEKYSEVQINFSNAYYDSKPIYSKTLQLDEFGAYNTKFDLSELCEDSYVIEVILNGETVSYKYLEVSEYETLNFKVDASMSKKQVYAGEKNTLTVKAALFDGTPLANTPLKYTFDAWDMDEKSGIITTDSNGNATIDLDTNMQSEYTNYSYASIRIQSIGEEVEDSAYTNFLIFPSKENIEDSGKYLKSNNKYEFKINTYEYDLNADNYKGKNTNRNGLITINKYRCEKQLISTYVDEYTKRVIENYGTVEIYEGTEYINFVTLNGSATIQYDNPYENTEVGIIKYSAQIYNDKMEILKNSDYAYISNLYSSSDSYYHESEYNMEYIEKDYKIGDTINLHVQKNEEEITDEVSIIHIIKSEKGIEVITTKDTNYKLTYIKEYGSSIYVKSFIFDGESISPANRYIDNYNSFNLDTSEFSISVDVKFDKEQYRPGDKAKIEITTTDNGKPISAEVNLSAVNEEYLAANEGNYSYIINSLYNYYSFDRNENVISHYLEYIFEGGGGGGDGEPRSAFATTAFFETVKTDESGKATAEIILPDNITNWVVEAQALSSNYKAGESIANLNVTLPFFITPVFSEKYLTSEKPIISLRANGISVSTGDDVKYKVEVTTPGGEKISNTLNSTIGKYAKYELPKLQKGIYKITISGECKGNNDSVTHEIEVFDTILDTQVVKDYEIPLNKIISINGGAGALYLYNTTTEKIVDDLFYLAYKPRLRNDQIVVSTIARQILWKLRGKEIKDQGPNLGYESEGIILMEGAGDDVSLTAKIASTGYENINKWSVTNYFQNKLEEQVMTIIHEGENSETLIRDQGGDIRENAFAYWGLAALKQPVLKELREFEAQVDKNDILARSILGLSYVDIGDYDNANRIFEEIKPKADVSEKEVYEYITMLALKLNDKDRDKFYETYLTLDREKEFSDFVRLFRVQNEMMNSVKKADIVVNVNGEEKKIELKDIGITEIIITKNDIVKVISMTDNIRAKIDQYEEVSKNSESKGILNKTYTYDGKELSNLKIGDVIKVKITVDYSKLNIERGYAGFEVVDILPNCFTFLPYQGYYGDEPIITMPYNRSGQKMSFYVHKTPEYEYYVEYEAIVTRSGYYISDGIVLKNDENEILDFYKAKDFQIKDL